MRLAGSLFVLAISLLLGYQATNISNTIKHLEASIQELEISIFDAPLREMASPARKPRSYPKYTQADFGTHFPVEYLDQYEPAPEIADAFWEAVKTVDYRQGSYYKEAESQYSAAGLLYEDYTRNNFFRNDKRFYVQFIDPTLGYGLFAQTEILSKQVIGIYHGMIVPSEGADTDYMWVYPETIVVNGKEIKLGIDSRFRGNLLRFINHDDDPNTSVSYVLVDNIWHAVYVAQRLIRPGEEVTVSYGEGYWSGRRKAQSSDSNMPEVQI
jgi:hypothetical protein